MKKPLIILIPILTIAIFFFSRPNLPKNITSKLIDNPKIVEQNRSSSFRDGGDMYLHLEMSAENSIIQTQKLESFEQVKLRTNLIQDLRNQVKEIFDHNLDLDDHTPIYIYKGNNHRNLYFIQIDVNNWFVYSI